MSGMRSTGRDCSVPEKSCRGLPRLWRAASYLLPFPRCSLELSTSVQPPSLAVPLALGPGLLAHSRLAGARGPTYWGEEDDGRKGYLQIC